TYFSHQVIAVGSLIPARTSTSPTPMAERYFALLPLTIRYESISRIRRFQRARSRGAQSLGLLPSNGFRGRRLTFLWEATMDTPDYPIPSGIGDSFSTPMALLG